MVRQFVDIINPDIFVLQYCTNDISDNSFQLEGRMSHVRNQKNLRPYLIDDSIAFRLPKYHPYLLLINNSRLFRKLDFEVMKLQYRFDDPTRLLGPEAPTIAAERAAAIALTGDLMSQLAAAMPKGTRSLTFSCDTSNPEEAETWKAMARAASLDVYPSVSEKIEAAEKNGEAVRVYDRGHWNRLGHRIAGEELANVIARHYL